MSVCRCSTKPPFSFVFTTRQVTCPNRLPSVSVFCLAHPPPPPPSLPSPLSPLVCLFLSLCLCLSLADLIRSEIPPPPHLPLLSLSLSLSLSVSPSPPPSHFVCLCLSFPSLSVRRPHPPPPLSFYQVIPSPPSIPPPSLSHRLVGPVARHLLREQQTQDGNPLNVVRLLPAPVTPLTYIWYTDGYPPCQTSGDLGSARRLVGPVSVYFD